MSNNKYQEAFEQTKAQAREDLYNAKLAQYANPEEGKLIENVLVAVTRIVAELENRNQSVETVSEKNQSEAEFIKRLIGDVEVYTDEDKEIAKAVLANTDRQIEQMANVRKVLEEQIDIFKQVNEFLTKSKIFDEQGKIVAAPLAVLMAKLFLACQAK